MTQAAPHPSEASTDLRPPNGEQQIADTLGRAYAKALLEMADEQNQLDEITAEVEELGGLLRTDPGLQQLLSSRMLSTKQRTATLQRIFAGRVNDTLYRFLQVVNRKDRLAALPGIVRAFGDLMAERRGIVEVDVYVASALDEEQAEQVAASIGKALDKEVVLRQQVDPSLIGGLKIRVGDRLIDGSVAAQLRQMKRKLTAAGREKARKLAGLSEE